MSIIIGGHYMIYSPGMMATRREFLASLAAQAQPGLKIFVLWDMEGTSGIFTREQAWYWENGVREEVAREARGSSPPT